MATDGHQVKERRPRAVGSNGLEVFDFGLLFQALAQSLRVGTLRVRGSEGERYICFDRGRVKAIYTRQSRYQLGHVLYNMRVVSKADLREAIELKKSKRTDLPLGEFLVERGVITAANLASAVFTQMTEELLHIFFWKDYSYEFFAGPIEESLKRISKEYVRVGGDQDVQELLLNVSRIADDIENFRKYTPSLRDVYEVTADPMEYLDQQGSPPELEELLNLLDGCRDVREILREMRMHRFNVMALLKDMCASGLIRPKNSFELLMLGENGYSTLPLQKLARIYERVLDLGVDGFDVTPQLAEIYEKLECPAKAARYFGENARNCREEGDVDQALASARRAVELQPNSHESRQLLIDVLEDVGGDELADALKEMADLKRGKRLHEQAEACLRRAIEVRPEDPELLFAHIEVYQRLGWAVDAGRQLLRLARLMRRTGDLAGAEQALREAIRSGPATVPLQSMLLNTLVRRGKQSEAEEEVPTLVALVQERRAEKRRDPAPALNSLSRRLEAVGLGGAQTARTLASSLVESGDIPSALNLLGRTAEREFAEKHYDRACEVLGRAVDLAPDNPDFREGLARALANNGNEDSALLHLGRLAEIHDEQGRSQEAERIYHKMLGIRPISANTLERLADLLARESREQEAAELLTRVGDLHRAAGMADAAIEYYDRACRLDPHEPTHLRRLAESLGPMLETPRSAETWEQLIQMLHERQEHATALEVGLQILHSDALAGTETGAPKLMPVLKECWEEVGARLRQAP